MHPEGSVGHPEGSDRERPRKGSRGRPEGRHCGVPSEEPKRVSEGTEVAATEAEIRNEIE
eukprot:9480635-Pyramimonas_sp.AAC.3